MNIKHQKVIIIVIGLFLLTSLIGCNTPKTFHFNPHGNQIEFDYPIGWSILHYDSSYANTKAYLEEVANTKVVNSSTTYINDKGYIFDMGEHEFTSFITIQDTIFEKPISPLQYIKTQQTIYKDKGAVEKYTSKNNVDFTVWKAQDLGYEGKYVIYYINYIDTTGNKHLLEIRSSGGFSYKEVEKALAQLINTLTLPS